MLGPYPLSDIDKYVEDEVTGTYILSRGNNAINYVGCSDADLKARLKKDLYETPDYTQFWFEVTSSLLEAYYLECKWYHEYNPPDNDSHPAVPPGATWKCPVAGCPWSS